MRKFLKYFNVLVLSICLSACKKNEDNLDFSKDLINTNDLIKQIIAEIQINYADEIAREKLEIGAINGMLEVLDEHSLYITNDELNAYNQTARGAILGVGIEIKNTKEGFEVLSVIDDSPASNAGIKPMDIITKIDGSDVKDMKFGDVVSKFSSDSGLKVKLEIVRNKTKTFEVDVKKSVIKLRSVKLDFIEDIALIKITYFNEGTLLDVSQAIKKVNKKNSVGVILDLRNNPGGILEQAISISDLFLSNKKIVEMKSRNADDSKTVLSDDIDLLNGIPIVVLINSKTASGAELMAAALGENKRAILIGEKTYGKGSQQTIIPIPKRGAIKLTTGYFLSPNGNMINHQGVSPDIEISKDDLHKKEGNNEKIEPIVLRAMDLIHGLSAISDGQEKAQVSK